MWALIRAGLRLSCRGVVLALVLGVLGGCGEEPKGTPDRAAAAASMPAAAGLARTYDTSCKLCHANPASGAPLTGDRQAWQSRLQQGVDSLLDHTINGHNGMPPMGLCMQCSEADFLALISFMSGQHLQ